MFVKCQVVGLVFWMAAAAGAQNIVVDAAPSHAVNSFSPPRALGGAIDRLRGGQTQGGQRKEHRTAAHRPGPQGNARAPAGAP